MEGRVDRSGALSSNHAYGTSRMLDAEFDSFDLNGDGVLDREEV